MQMRFLHLDEMRAQFGCNDAVMFKVTNLLIGQRRGLHTSEVICGKH